MIRRLTSRSGFVPHSGWMIFERLTRLTFGILVGSLIARTLGPSLFGELVFAQLALALLAAVAALGMDAMLIKWLHDDSVPAGKLLSSLLVARLISSSSLALLLFVIAFYLVPSNEALLISILATVLVFQSANVLDQFFQAQLLGQVGARAAILSMVISNSIRVGFVWVNADVVAFAWTFVIESAIYCLLLIFQFLRAPGRPHLARPNLRVAFVKLLQSSPLVPTALVGSLFLMIEQFILRWFAGAEQMGIYAASARIADGWYSLLAVGAASVYPLIVSQANASVQEKRVQMLVLYEIAFLGSLTAAIVITVFAVGLIDLLFGESFAEAASVLHIQIWSGIFIGWRLIGGRWMLSQGLTWLAFRRVALGALVNTLACIALIPKFGVTGAAAASMAAHVTAGLIADLVHPQTREQGLLKMRAVLLTELRKRLMWRFGRRGC